MRHAGDGRAPAVFHVGGGTRNGAGGGNAPEQGRCDIACALGHELHVAAVVGADHRIRHDAGEQGLDCRQDGNGDAVGQLFAEQIYAEHGDVEFRDAGVDGVEVADGVDVHVEAVDQDDSCHKGDKRAGDALVDARPAEPSSSRRRRSSS